MLAPAYAGAHRWGRSGHLVAPRGWMSHWGRRDGGGHGRFLPGKVG